MVGLLKVAAEGEVVMFSKEEPSGAVVVPADVPVGVEAVGGQVVPRWRWLVSIRLALS